MKRLSAISLVLANLVVAGIVLFEQWGYYAVLLVYWLESMVIGFYALGRLAVACWFGEPLGRWIGMANAGSRVMLSVFAGAFFIVKFGGFALGMGFLVALVPGYLAEATGTGDIKVVTDALGSVGPGVATAAALLFVSHGISFFVNFVGRDEYKHRNIVVILFEPYLRMVLVLVVLVAGVLGAAFLPALSHATGFAVAVILLKTVVDLVSHAIDHRRRASGEPAAAPATPAVEPR
jgi:hypothetical protein